MLPFQVDSPFGVWSFIGGCKHSPHWRRVTSAANISDPVSREDVSMALQEVGIDHLELTESHGAGLRYGSCFWAGDYGGRRPAWENTNDDHRGEKPKRLPEGSM